MIGLAKSAVQVVAPALASLLLTVSGLHLVMSIDLLSLLPGLVAVLLVFLPRAERTQTGMAAAGNFWHEFRFGFRYIFAHPGLSGILLIFCGINLFAGFTYMSILSPMILTRTQGDQMALGTVQTVMGIGGILGGLVLTLWRSPRRKAALFTWSTLISFGVCDFLTAASRSVVSWSVAGFSFRVLHPVHGQPVLHPVAGARPRGCAGTRLFGARDADHPAHAHWYPAGRAGG